MDARRKDRRTMNHEDRIRALRGIAEMAQPGAMAGATGIALGVIAATLLDHERRLPPEAPPVAAPQYTPAELLAIAAEEGREEPGPILYPDAARPIEFVAALMACGITVEVDTGKRTVTAIARGLRQLYAWDYLTALGIAPHRLAAEVAADFGAVKP